MLVKQMRSLTITYFHTGIRTIIGVESFHGPVRDGKGWFHLAMVVRLKKDDLWAAARSARRNQKIQLGRSSAASGRNTADTQVSDCSSLSLENEAARL